MAKQAVSDPSEHFAPRKPVPPAGFWSIHFVHGVTSPLGMDRLADKLAQGWEPFAMDAGVMALRKKG